MHVLFGIFNPIEINSLFSPRALGALLLPRFLSFICFFIDATTPSNRHLPRTGSGAPFTYANEILDDITVGIGEPHQDDAGARGRGGVYPINIAVHHSALIDCTQQGARSNRDAYIGGNNLQRLAQGPNIVPTRSRSDVHQLLVGELAEVDGIHDLDRVILRRSHASLFLVKGDLVHFRGTFEPLGGHAHQGNISLACTNVGQRIVGTSTGDLPSRNALVEAAEPLIRLYPSAKDNLQVTAWSRTATLRLAGRRLVGLRLVVRRLTRLGLIGHGTNTRAVH